MRCGLIPTDVSEAALLVPGGRRGPVSVVVLAGLDQMSCRGFWQAARRRHEQDTLREGAWRERGRERWENTLILKSW
jgi:hypothetical protein